jgi:3-oxoacyl-[acyl-carrier protein] reductase
MHNLTGSVAMVTGGATGIGAAIVEQLALHGADVACCYHTSRAAAQELAEKLEQRERHILLVKLDVGNSQEVREVVESIGAHFERPVSILVNNAGDMIETSPVDSMDEALWDRVIEVNLKGAFLCARYCIPAMKAARAGRIINITSISARTGGGPGGAHYAASKGGLEALTRALAKELGPFNITVNGVAPGVVYTRIHERFNTPESLERLRQNIPLARLGVPDEVARLVAFLASEGGAYITGENIAVNGGLRMD